jgi:hypothetical protein
MTHREKFSWPTREDLKKMSQEEILQKQNEYVEYLSRKYTVGTKVRLVEQYAGYPEGTTGKIISVDPRIEVAWDSHPAKHLEGRTASMSHELDAIISVKRKLF